MSTLTLHNVWHHTRIFYAEGGLSMLLNFFLLTIIRRFAVHKYKDGVLSLAYYMYIQYSEFYVHIDK